MLGGGLQHKAEMGRIIRLVEVFIAPLMVIYAVLVAAGFIASRHSVAPSVLVIISIAWLCVSLYYYYIDARSQSDEVIRSITTHLFVLAFIVLVIGLTQPFVVLYVLLAVNSYVAFGRRGLIASLSALIVTALLDIWLQPTLGLAAAGEILASALALSVLAVSVVAIISVQETRRQAFLHSQERARLQYDRMLTIINNLTDATFSTNEKGSVLMYNAACLDLLDTNDNLRGKNIADLFTLTNTDDEPVNLLDIFKDATRSTRRDDLNLIYKDGEQVRLELTFSPIRSSYSIGKKGQEQGGYIMIARDVTKQKSLEEQRDEFISTVSHELRTPITIVEGTLSNLDVMMKNPQYSSDPVKLSASVTTAHDQVLYLARMVNDLSTLSRAERGIADAPEIIDVSDLLHTMHKQYEGEALKKQLHLNLEATGRLGKVNVSRLYLEELLQNFITNGIKYTKEGSVTITAKRSKGQVTFAVSDTGIGISRGEQQKVFNKFYRSEDYRIRETNGTGLGLHVSKTLANKLQTKIVLKSRLNHGSTFSFELPVEP